MVLMSETAFEPRCAVGCLEERVLGDGAGGDQVKLELCKEVGGDAWADILR